MGLAFSLICAAKEMVVQGCSASATVSGLMHRLLIQQQASVVRMELAAVSAAQRVVIT